jgi:hypothetical protein
MIIETDIANATQNHKKKKKTSKGKVDELYIIASILYEHFLFLVNKVLSF